MTMVRRRRQCEDHDALGSATRSGVRVRSSAGGGCQGAVPYAPVQEGQAAGAGGEQEKAREQAGHGCGAGVR